MSRDLLFSNVEIFCREATHTGLNARIRTRLDRETNSKDLNALTAEAYAELRRIAAYHLQGERRNHTLRPTELVHEAYLRLQKQHSLRSTDRLYFLSLASTLMRRVLVDHARRRRRKKRGDGQEHLPLDTICAETQFGSETTLVDILMLDASLEDLGRLDPDQVRIVELHFYGGLTFEEIAQLLDVSLRTVTREWRFARTWLFNRLNGDRNDAA